MARLPGYLRVLQAAAAVGVETISSGELAAQVGVHPALLRRDLSQLGSYGTRGVGYHVGTLIREIGRVVGDRLVWPVVIVGAGNLGQALARYQGLRDRGFELAALIDVSPQLIGTEIAGVPVSPPQDLPRIAADRKPVIGVVTTPASQAQQVTEELVACGIRRILNFTFQPVDVPSWVTVRAVNLASEMQVLIYHELSSSDPPGSGENALDLTRRGQD